MWFKNYYMKINLKNGIDKLVFGMKQNDVMAIYGKPNRIYTDEEDNTVFNYNAQKLRLTFYVDEDLRLGYIVCSSKDLSFFGKKIIGCSIADVKKDLAANEITDYEPEEFDTYLNYFNEENWFVLQTEFDEVVRLEIGAIINDDEEFDWKF